MAEHGTILLGQLQLVERSDGNRPEVSIGRFYARAITGA